ncbi:MAG: UDP-N-acetylmuramoyl-tripeptide--D-alanyl-D-alanine ligase [Limimaricola sp.]|uniref:UDP-N-acetylmuramoyl-tripeptide--D-alanyl-D- alanine ligase n=1 Tax=Limimaricola sp. TaxID=2211665 RepID=UPI001D4E678D|nr:UDP-N-acetylmuramoyl-tripeptide--D-alanyl-D-alanine ligase [Limimaricola sp.]MBI1418584.1 UDP-N-acetylmuramoyl-tripeptide--D-alanyl-D-alanine ligase [Limimaricola sp.]
MTLWTAAEAAAATGGTATAPFVANGVSIDTRTLEPGDLFVALKATRDGHDFVAQALAGGAAAALVTHHPADVPADAPLLIVPDVQAALEDLGRAGRARSRARVAAITGSVGKTSAKEMLRAALDGQGRVHAAEASYNNHWGVPLTLARMPPDADFAVIEIGMNHPGEIAPLARQARPHAVMITTVAAAHFEAFGSLEGIAMEKASICEGLEPNGTAVLHGDLPQTDILVDTARRAGAHVVLFGMQPHDHHRLTRIRVGDGHTVAEGRAWRTPILLNVASEGRHFALNALGVLALATSLGADRARSLCGLAGWSPPAGRGTRETVLLDVARENETIDLIDDAFNANPASMAAALEVLAAAQPRNGVGRISQGRRVAILGDMLELGPTEAEMHADLARLPAMADISTVHCVGPRMRALHAALPRDKRGVLADRAEDLTPRVARLLDAGDVVLVKGSKGSRVSLVVDAIRKLRHRGPVPDMEA